MNLALMLIFSLLGSATNNGWNIAFNETFDWMIVNDGVMGGRSSSRFKVKDDILHFSGTLSLENNGGFVSLRSPYGSTDLSVYKKLVITYKLDHGEMGFSMNRHQQYYLPNYKVYLEQSEEWKTVTFKLKNFEEEVMAKKTGKAIPAEALKEIIRIGFIKSDKDTTPFELQVKELRFE